MSNREQLIQALSQLDPATFDDVIASAYQRRLGTDGVTLQPPDQGATSAEYAEWLARRHMSSDMAIERVVYLPGGAPDDEIRLLEVNRLLNPPEPDAIEPLDFSPDSGPPFKVFVADITTDQWKRIRRTPDSLLPPGWGLEDSRIFTRG